MIRRNFARALIKNREGDNWEFGDGPLVLQPPVTGFH